MIHLVKLCVGADSVDDLVQWQDHVVKERKRHGLSPFPTHETRQTPKRGDELVKGGSLYWVIRGTILVRQELVAVNTYDDRLGKSFCELVLDPRLVLTEPQGRKAFQGWRYLKPEDAPADLATSSARDVPPELGLALKDAGVW